MTKHDSTTPAPEDDVIMFTVAKAARGDVEFSEWVRDARDPDVWWRAVSDGIYNDLDDLSGVEFHTWEYIERGWHAGDCECALRGDTEPCRYEPEPNNPEWTDVPLYDIRYPDDEESRA